MDIEFEAKDWIIIIGIMAFLCLIGFEVKQSRKEREARGDTGSSYHYRLTDEEPASIKGAKVYYDTYQNRFDITDTEIEVFRSPMFVVNTYIHVVGDNPVEVNSATTYPGEYHNWYRGEYHPKLKPAIKGQKLEMTSEVKDCNLHVYVKAK